MRAGQRNAQLDGRGVGDLAARGHARQRQQRRLLDVRQQPLVDCRRRRRTDAVEDVHLLHAMSQSRPAELATLCPCCVPYCVGAYAQYQQA